MKTALLLHRLSSRKGVILAVLVAGTCFSTLGCLYSWIPFVENIISGVGSIGF